MNDPTLSPWEDRDVFERRMWFRTNDLVMMITLVWIFLLMSDEFKGVVIGMILSISLVDIAVFSIPLPKLFQYIMITLFDIVLLIAVAVLMTIIFFIPGCDIYSTIWCRHKVQQVIQLWMLFIYFCGISLVHNYNIMMSIMFPSVDSQSS